MAKRKKKVEEVPVEEVTEEMIVEEVPVDYPETEPESEMKSEVGFKNTSGGLFDVFGISWEVDECKEVPKEIQKEKKFKHAVKLKCLTEM